MKVIPAQSVAVPGSVPTVIPQIARDPDLAASRPMLPTKPAKDENPALAFSKVTVEKVAPYSDSPIHPVKTVRRRKIIVNKPKPQTSPYIECSVCGHHVILDPKKVREND